MLLPPALRLLIFRRRAIRCLREVDLLPPPDILRLRGDAMVRRHGMIFRCLLAYADFRCRRLRRRLS